MSKKPDVTKYRKDRTDKIESVIRSVNLDQSHQDFINRENLNLSAITRDAIQALIDATATIG